MTAKENLHTKTFMPNPLRIFVSEEECSRSSEKSISTDLCEEKTNSIRSHKGLLQQPCKTSPFPEKGADTCHLA